MRRIEITPPTFCFPKKDPEHPCECQNRPMELTHKTGLVFWKKAPGDHVEKGEALAEAEVEKKTVELPAPEAGTLSEICVHEGDIFSFGEVLGVMLIPAEMEEPDA